MNAARYVDTVNDITLNAQTKIRALASIHTLASLMLSTVYPSERQKIMKIIKATKDLIKDVKQIAILTVELIKNATIRTTTGMQPMKYEGVGFTAKALGPRKRSLDCLLKRLATIDTDKLQDGFKLPGYKKLDGTTVAEEWVTAIWFKKGWANNAVVKNAQIILEYFQHLDLQLKPQISGLQLENALTIEAAQRANRIAGRKAREAEREQAGREQAEREEAERSRSNKSVGESKKRKAPLYLKF